jgi:hypothetical protein
MSNTHCSIEFFDKNGAPVGESTTLEEGSIPGVARTLQQEGVVAIEVHFDDGTSQEYRFLNRSTTGG